jgi:hypothetical protein
LLAEIFGASSTKNRLATAWGECNVIAELVIDRSLPAGFVGVRGRLGVMPQ